MKKVFINLKQTQGGMIKNGWTASVAIAYGKKGKNEIAIGESVIYNTKEQAWNTISKRVSELNFEEDEIFINYYKVNSLEEVENIVDVIVT